MLFLVQAYTNESNLLNYVCLDSVTGKTVTVSASQWVNTPNREQIVGVEYVSGQPKWTTPIYTSAVVDNRGVSDITRKSGSCFTIREIVFDSRSGRGATHYNGVNFEQSGSFKSATVERLLSQGLVYNGFNSQKLSVHIKRVSGSGVLQETDIFFVPYQGKWAIAFPSVVFSGTSLTCDSKIYGDNSKTVLQAVIDIFEGYLA